MNEPAVTLQSYLQDELKLAVGPKQLRILSASSSELKRFGWEKIASHGIQGNSDTEMLDVFSFTVPGTGTYALESETSGPLNELFAKYVGGGGTGGTSEDTSFMGWLKEKKLDSIADVLMEAGAEDKMDLLELEEDDIAELGLKTLQRKKLEKTIAELRNPPAEAAPTPAKDDKLLVQWLHEHKLDFAIPALQTLGGLYEPQDLIQLEGAAISELGLKTLQKKKLKKAIAELVASAVPTVDLLAEWLKENKLECIALALSTAGVTQLSDLMKFEDDAINELGLTSLQRRKMAKECRALKEKSGVSTQGEKAKKEAEERAKKEAEEKTKKEAEEEAKKAEEQAKEAEEQAKKKAEEKAAEEKAKKEAEEKAKKEAKEKAKKEAEEKPKK
jgi:hypothetical protein